MLKSQYNVQYNVSDTSTHPHLQRDIVWQTAKNNKIFTVVCMHIYSSNTIPHISYLNTRITGLLWTVQARHIIKRQKGFSISFSALTLLVQRQKVHPDCKKLDVTGVGGEDLTGALHVISPAVTNTYIILSSNKIQNSGLLWYILVPANQCISITYQWWAL